MPATASGVDAHKPPRLAAIGRDDDQELLSVRYDFHRGLALDRFTRTPVRAMNIRYIALGPMR